MLTKGCDRPLVCKQMHALCIEHRPNNNMGHVCCKQRSTDAAVNFVVMKQACYRPAAVPCQLCWQKLTREVKATENNRMSADTTDNTSCVQKLSQPNRRHAAAALAKFLRAGSLMFADVT